MVDAGLTPYQALRTGTQNVGTYFRTTDGVVAAGRRADLLLLDANPLQDIGNSTRIAGVMVNGRWLPKADIDKRLAEGTRVKARGRVRRAAGRAAGALLSLSPSFTQRLRRIDRRGAAGGNQARDRRGEGERTMTAANVTGS